MSSALCAVKEVDTLQLVGYCPKPSFYQNNDQEFLLIISQQGIHQYNINSNQMDLLQEYPSNYRLLYEHAQFWDPKHQIVYAYGNGIFLQFDLKNALLENIDRQSTDYNHLLHDAAGYMSTVFLPFINKIYIEPYYLYDINTKNIIKLKHKTLNLGIANIISSKLLYVFSSNSNSHKILILGGYYEDRIWEIDVSHFYDKNHNISENEIVFNKLNVNIKLPCVMDDSFYDVILGFQNIIFIFYEHDSDGRVGDASEVKNGDVWCLDLETEQLFKSQFTIPFSSHCKHDAHNGNNFYAFKCKNNMAHLLDISAKFHCVVSLYDLIPTKLNNVYFQHYEKLVMRYIIKHENNHIIPNIPYVIKRLILRYFPLFL